MSLRNRPTVPATPRVISPSPTPSEREASQDSAYFGPVTRSAARKRRATPQPVEEDVDEDEFDNSPELRRSRTRSRSPVNIRRVNGMTTRTARAASTQKTPQKKAVAAPEPATNGKGPETNGHLSPASAALPGWSWRDFSRSPSPLGLIPIHRQWRTFVHKHEVPRKALHVSIGFFVIWLYVSGTQTRSVCPYLMGALIPIASIDYFRHLYPSFNRVYVKFLGALMRESEFAGYNGVIFYLLGAWVVLYFFPKDVGVMGVMLLSWCDTAASTFGRLYGRHTPRIRKGKSLAGSIAAFLVGVATAGWFWGWLAPTVGPLPGDDNFMFKGVLRLPRTVAGAFGLVDDQATISGSLAVGLMSIWSGLVAATSEVVDIFGWDDNLTIPVLSGLGIWGFLKVFG
ncbi:CTP-dependent diacylglycerol kinase 1 [Pleurostoma richardsiae]|uniref:CTP-dependent diacylglycerol kinase 1 n=1 Tax=Pleurostoma richardsiae TaxID=41990 RepID=A0AA38RKK5_9PEZI|nr:CTP-dependent diacylglycerol kinase 1 [Pleurostoma richardsiae]